MKVERSHGKPRVQAPQPEDVGAGVPEAPPVLAGPADRDHAGRFRPGNRTSVIGAKKKNAKARTKAASTARMRRLLPEETFPVDAFYSRFLDLYGDTWTKETAERIARTHGRGEIGPDAVEAIRSAGLDLAEARFLREVAASKAFRWNVDETRKPAAVPRLELLEKASAAEERAQKKIAWARSFAESDAKAKPTRPVFDVAERVAMIERKRAERAALAATVTEHEPEEEEHEQPADRVLPEEEEQPAPVAPSHEATLLRLQRQAPRPEGYRPTPSANVVPPSEPLERWLPSALAPWSARFQGLGHMALRGRIGAVLQRVGALQVAGEFGKREAEIIGAVTAWRNRAMALGHFEGEAR